MRKEVSPRLNTQKTDGLKRKWTDLEAHLSKMTFAEIIPDSRTESIKVDLSKNTLDRLKIASTSREQLSAYIFDSIDTGNSVWIAQKEGRAKDGNDYTDPALLKMIQLQGRKQKLSFEEYVQKLNIVPVSISYQFEPCDIAKANERYHKDKYGDYQKQDGEDMDSIMEGFRSNKGHVHLAFGQPIVSGCESPEELAQTIDQQILSSFYLLDLLIF